MGRCEIDLQMGAFNSARKFCWVGVGVEIENEVHPFDHCIIVSDPSQKNFMIDYPGNEEWQEKVMLLWWVYLNQEKKTFSRWEKSMWVRGAMINYLFYSAVIVIKVKSEFSTDDDDDKSGVNFLSSFCLSKKRKQMSQQLLVNPNLYYRNFFISATFKNSDLELAK